ncbi:MAG TPA: AAA family ATPase [Treponemataceae bacterium]|nr:AAA family ATPase [Treponemataceae bacterium]
MGGKQQLIKKNLPYIKVLPQWAQELSYKYCSKTVNMYLVHGNIRDFLPHSMNEGEFSFKKIQEYISEVLFGNENIVVYYDRSSGVSFCTLEMEKEYLATMKHFFPKLSDTELLSKDPRLAFEYLEKYFLINIPRNKRIVFLIDYAETIIPYENIGLLDDTDRFCFVTLNRWSHEPFFTQGDVSIIVLTENVSDINLRISSSPSVVKVHIPLPDAFLRKHFLDYLLSQDLLLLERGMTSEKMSALSAGLNLWHLHQIATESFQEDVPIDLSYLRQKKREILEKEGAGLIEFIDANHDLSTVSGHDFVIGRLKNAARAIKQNQLDVLPMGYLISGPIGTGKSFLVQAFAGEIGIPMVRLCNFSSQANGIVETNLERVFNILKALSPVAVMIDEADTLLGRRDDNRGDGSNSRIFGQIASFMGNTAYRGKILWFLITSRPDLIPIDLKRQGRAEEHLALFYPDSVEEKIALFEALKKKLSIKVEQDSFHDVFKKINFEISGADIEAILVRSKMHAAMDKRIIVTKADLEHTIRDFIPPSYPHEIALQNLVAVLECTSKQMVPKRFQNLDRGKLAQEIRDLKQLLQI